MATPEQEREQQKAYEEALAAGLNPEPMVQRVDLEALAGADTFARVGQIEALDQITPTQLRGIPMRFHTPSKRLLWQALGQEHIEPDLLDFIDRMPADAVYYDIGASNGLFALYAAATNKQVVCFEPETANFALLNYNTYLNQAQIRHNVRNFNVALSDATELGKLFIKKFEAGGHMKILDTPVQRGHAEFQPEFVQYVLKYRLDDFIALTGIPTPNFLKIDVDGAELAVLHGMTNTLRAPSLQKLMIELEEGEHLATCLAQIETAGFRLESKKRVQNYFGEDNYIFSRY